MTAEGSVHQNKEEQQAADDTDTTLTTLTLAPCNDGAPRAESGTVFLFCGLGKLPPRGWPPEVVKPKQLAPVRGAFKRTQSKSVVSA